MFHGQSGANLKETLRIFLDQLVQDFSSSLIRQSLEDITHSTTIGKQLLA